MPIYMPHAAADAVAAAAADITRLMLMLAFARYTHTFSRHDA